MQQPGHIDLPPMFLEGMKDLLGDEFTAFKASFESPPNAGLRVNTLKISPQALQERLPFPLTPIPWSPTGFWLSESLTGEDLNSPGRHPYHTAGLYYLQEPSAMAVAEALAPLPGDKVLDLCASPGGKTTHLSALMGDRGLLVANETNSRRVWQLTKNLERWGTHIAVVMNETPERLSRQFGPSFDKVLVDAPCSGEGMFRKNELACRDWSPELVQGCAIRQSAILEQAVTLIHPGGFLAYSTCTFNPLENESTLARLLDRHPELEIVELPDYPNIDHGHPEWVDQIPAGAKLGRARRLWPHHNCGEGHFFALLQKSHFTPALISDDRHNEKLLLHRARSAQNLRQPPKQVIYLFDEFCRLNLHDNVFPESSVGRRLVLHGSHLYMSPEALPELGDLHVIHPGFWLGIIKGEKKIRFEPSHALALGLRSDQVQRILNFDPTDATLLNFLHGDALPSLGEPGWVLVTVDHFPLGWGRRVSGALKNHYPRGLRR